MEVSVALAEEQHRKCPLIPYSRLPLSIAAYLLSKLKYRARIVRFVSFAKVAPYRKGLVARCLQTNNMLLSVVVAAERLVVADTVWVAAEIADFAAVVAC